MYNPLPLAVFIATIFLVFKHPFVRIPLTYKYIHLDYGLAPVLGVIFLIITLSAPPAVVLSGIFGSDGLKPYSVLILILSLSYICISLEISGFFEYISLRVARLAGNSGRRLFLYIFLLTLLLTLFTDNDIIILTMTFIVLYIARNSGMKPMPFLFAQFFAVNIAGMALYIGNPTNIVVADAAGINFAEYAKWMLLPSLVSAVACLGMLWLIFRQDIPQKIDGPGLSVVSIRDKKSASFGLLALILVIVLMSIPSSWTGLPVWIFPLIMASAVLVNDALRYRSGVFHVVSKVPWKTVPFLLGLFIIIESMASAGWISLFSDVVGYLSGSMLGMVFGVCVLSSLMACLMNHHPMVIFFVRGIQGLQLPATQRLGSSLALIAGSNFGANLTLIGALAGIMWADILSERGQNISFSKFSKYGFAVMIPVTLVACATLMLELVLWGAG
ncbi:MAG: ArsB/NhaD family transporter [Candidatus Hadarchaeales archaeon]